MINDETLDRVLDFVVEDTARYQDEDGIYQVLDLTDYTLAGSVICDIDDESLDLPLEFEIVVGVDGKYIMTLSNANRDSIFLNYPKRLGMLYEVKAHKSPAGGLTIRQGFLNLIHSRGLSGI